MPVPVPEKDRLIQIIAALFPTDSQWPDTNEYGRRFLAQAREEATPDDWRDEPIEVLRIYARLCMAEEQRQANRTMAGIETRRGRRPNW